MTTHSSLQGTWTILLTGSRRWKESEMLVRALEEQLRFARDNRLQLQVIYGDCPTGVDRTTKVWCSAVGYPSVLVHEEFADWNRDCGEHCNHAPRRDAAGRNYCPAAGVFRNQRMVDIGPDVCLGFLTPDSRGTRDCVARARNAGVPVIEHSPKGRTDAGHRAWDEIKARKLALIA